MDNNYLCVRYCKSVFVMLLLSESYFNVDAIIFTTALAGKEYIQVKQTSLYHNTP